MLRAMIDPGEWCAVIAAGGVAEPDVAAASGYGVKALAEFGGKPSVRWVVEACLEAGIERTVVAGVPEVRAAVQADVVFADPGGSGFETARNGVYALGDMAPSQPVLFLPSDTPLLTGADIAHFMNSVASRVSDVNWFAVGLSPEADVEREYPGAAYSFIRLRDGSFASGALYAASRAGFDGATPIIEHGNRNRKSLLRLVMKFGLVNLLRFYLGRVGVLDAERIAGRVLGGTALIVPDCHPRTTFDFDSAADWKRLRSVFEPTRS